MTKKMVLIVIIIIAFFGGYNNNASYSRLNKYILIIYPSETDIGGFTCEVIELTFKDGFVCYITSGLRRGVNINIRELGTILNLINRKIPDIKIFIHNHFEMGEFSLDDWKFFSNLRQFGFRGEFLLYYKGDLYKR